MLEPEYFENKEDRIIEIYQKWSDYIMRDIAMRLLKAGEMSGTADWLLYKLEQAGESREKILKELSKLMGMTTKELRRLLQDAVLTSWKDDAEVYRRLGVEIMSPLEVPAVITVMDAEYQKSLGELENLTRTTMDQAYKDLINMMDEAEYLVSSGVKSYSAATCEILDRYAGKGITVKYPSGTERSLEAAVRLCVVTSMNQTAAQVTNQYISEADAEYVLVSAHLGARTRQKGQPELSGHDSWQGRVYRISGSEEGFPNLAEKTGYDINLKTGKGSVINPLGLHGYNCRHGHKPWDKDLKNPYLNDDGTLKIDSEENRKMAEKRAKQRAMERAIRKTKREILVKEQELAGIAETDVKEILNEDYERLSYKLRQQNQAYNKYCEENDLTKQYDRIKVSGFNKKQSDKARSAAIKYKNKEGKK